MADFCFSWLNRLGRCLYTSVEWSLWPSQLVLSSPKQPPDQVRGRLALGVSCPRSSGRCIPRPLHPHFCLPEQTVGKHEEEVSQSEAALGPTCGQGVNSAPVSSLPPIPLFFFFLSHLWAVVWGDGRFRGLSTGPSPSQEGGPPQLSVRPAREGGHFLFLPLCVFCHTASLTAPQNAPRSQATKAPGHGHQPQTAREQTQ